MITGTSTKVSLHRENEEILPKATVDLRITARYKGHVEICPDFGVRAAAESTSESEVELSRRKSNKIPTSTGLAHERVSIGGPSMRIEVIFPNNPIFMNSSRQTPNT